jgi:UDP-N-acetyl-D-mannosaminuronate dehydrogenase
VTEECGVIVVGLGEVGRPLFELLSDTYRVTGVDIKTPDEPVGSVDVLHV